MRIEKGFVLGLVIGIGVFICIAGFPAGHAHAASPPTTDDFSVLYNFGSVANDGANPHGSLALSGSTFYGMTSGIGNYADGNGTIFRINADGTGYQVLHNFAGSPYDGANPQGDLTVSGSTLYGMTPGGGACLSGTIFKINMDGTGYQVLYNFGTVQNDAYCPYGSLTLSGSTLYGMAASGGVNGSGVIFQINTDGTGYQVLHSFGGVGTDGCYPYGSLTLSGTTLYGMTSGGGAGGSGTIFQINTDGTGYMVLYSFGGFANDGVNPFGSLTLWGSTLYGMTQCGGAGGSGTIFRINTNGAEYQVLYSFAGYPNDGALPIGSLTISGSTLYGMTSQGGGGNGFGLGTIFRINTSGAAYQVLYDFGSASSNDGSSVTLSGTTIYGMENGGGVYGKGAIFSVSDTPAVPGAPTGVTAAAGIAQAAVSFTAPAGGPPVSFYAVTSNLGGITATGDGSPIIMQGLDNGTAYTFTVTASNTIGTGPPSVPSNSVTPYAVPPSSIAALAGTWNADFIVSGSDAPEWERGTVTVNPDETLSGVSITDNNGNPDQVFNNNAIAFWSSPGGLFLTTGQPNDTLCQIDSGNTVIVCTETDLSNGSPGLMIFTKQAASCSLVDLTGAWEGNFLTSSGQYSGAAETDSLTIGSNGTWTDSTTGGTGTWPISSSGVITDPSDSTFSGVMGADKTVMVATSGANINPAVLSVYARQAASYLPEDLAGTWQGNSLSMWTWERDTLTINQDGTFTMSSTANDGSTNNNITGTCALSPYGAITLVTNAGSSQSVISGDMAADKTVMVTTAQSSINDTIEIFTKSAAGSLTVTISPDAAASAGAMWSVDGGAWQTSGATVSNLSVGSHTVAFNNITGWTTPAGQTANITNAQTTSLGGAYTQQTGSLTVTISPAGAVTEGAMWNVDGGSWQRSGTTVSGITVGSHTVAFINVKGWGIPSGRTANVSNGQTASAIGTYTPVFAAIFTASTTSGKAPLTVHFSDSSAGSITKWLWNFGDGQTSTIRSPSHTYGKAGAYTVTLTVTGAGGTNTCTQPDYITVYAAPEANFSASPSSGKAPLRVNFTNKSTGLVTSWLWRFGDGATSTDESPDHTYNTPGTYTAMLTAYGPGGTGSKTLIIRVTKRMGGTPTLLTNLNAGAASLFRQTGGLRRI
ncbi:MAG: choice-of-anchor tandem repeat GloVer-containing protein [Syntrophobacteraceae bacterium]